MVVPNEFSYKSSLATFECVHKPYATQNRTKMCNSIFWKIAILAEFDNSEKVFLEFLNRENFSQSEKDQVWREYESKQFGRGV